MGQCVACQRSKAISTDLQLLSQAGDRVPHDIGDHYLCARTSGAPLQLPESDAKQDRHSLQVTYATLHKCAL